MNSYEEKQQRRRERYEQRAEKARAESKSRANSQNVQTLADMMGEPVKIGHHSEQRHRKLIERADNDMRYAAIMLRIATESGDIEAQQRWGLTIWKLSEEYWK